MPAIKTPTKYDAKRGVVRDEQGNIICEIPAGFGEKAAIEARCELIGQAIVDALNSASENAELRERVEAYKAMLAGVRRIEFVDGTVLAQGFALQGADLAYWFYEPDGKDFDSALDAYKALRGEEGK